VGLHRTLPATMGGANSIMVRTEKPSYIGGDEVRGTIYLMCQEPCASQGVFLKLKGMERTRWEVQRSRSVQGRGPDGQPTTRTETYTETFHGLHTFFKAKVPVYPVPGMIAPGSYEFPFAFRLPPGLPGVYHEDTRTHSAHVFYKLKAEVHVPGLFKSNIKHTQRLVVHEGLFSEVRPVSREAQSKVTQCCCIDKGTASLRATFDKNAYVPGETARVVCEVDNQSSLRLRHVRSKLKRRLTLHDNAGRRHQMVDTLAQGSYDGVDPFTSCMGEAARFVPLLLANNTREPVQPQTHGRLVTCDYWVEVELDVPMGSDINVVLETTIYAPIPVPAPLVAPPGWSAPQTMAPVALDFTNPAYNY